MTVRMVPGFLPSTDGFRFANSFPHVPVRRIGIPGVVSLSIGDASNGLCGGMAFAARDYYEARRPPPDLATPPGDGELFDYLVDRLLVIGIAPDITEHSTREGKVYCSVVLDVFSRRVVGWSIDSSPSAMLVTTALGMAIDSRRPGPGALIHFDHGTQFTSWPFTKRAMDSGLVPSMGSIGDCFDNAVVESFWARM